MCKHLTIEQLRHLRRRALYSLPPLEQNAFSSELETWCRDFVGRARAGELWSQLVHTMFALTSMAAPAETTGHVPARNGQLLRAWLRRQARSIVLRNVYRDIDRINFGRHHELVQLDEKDLDTEHTVEPTEQAELHVDRIWKGIVVSAERHFENESDALLLLRFLSKTNKVAFGGQSKIVGLSKK